VNNTIIGFVLFSSILFTDAHAENLIEQYKQSRKVIVDTQKAELCFADTQDCHKVLIGKTTPKGVFPLTLYTTTKKGYGGEIIGFKEEKDFLFALHRVWLGKPSERRQERIVSNNVSDRIMTNGCINVSDAVYEKLRQYFVLEVI
jgi:hypothetical protein